MVLHTMTVHPRGILPAQAAKAWYLRVKAKKKWREIQEEVVNAAGGTPSEHALENAVARMKSRKPHGVPKYKYQNCGVKKYHTRAVLALARRGPGPLPLEGGFGGGA